MKLPKFSDKDWFNVAVIVCIGVTLFVLLSNISSVIAVLARIIGYFRPVILGIIIVWVVMFVLSLAMKGDAYTNLLKDNGGLQWLHDHNVLMKISLKDIFS